MKTILKFRTKLSDSNKDKFKRVISSKQNLTLTRICESRTNAGTYDISVRGNVKDLKNLWSKSFGSKTFSNLTEEQKQLFQKCLEDAVVGATAAPVATDAVSSSGSNSSAVNGLVQSDILGNWKSGQGFLAAKTDYDNNIVPDMLSVVNTRITESENDPTDVVTMDVPLLIRILEYAREDTNSDLDLHFMAENLIAMSREHDVLTMGDYDEIVDIEASDNEEADDDLDEIDEAGKKRKKRYRKVRYPVLRRYYGWFPMIPWLDPHHHHDTPKPTIPPVDSDTTEMSDSTIDSGTGDAGGDVAGTGDAGTAVGENEERIEEADDEDQNSDQNDSNDQNNDENQKENDQKPESNDKENKEEEQKEFKPKDQDLARINSFSEKSIEDTLIRYYKNNIVKDPNNIINSNLNDLVILNSIALLDDGSYLIKFKTKDDTEPKFAHMKMYNGFLMPFLQNEKLYLSKIELKQFLDKSGKSNSNVNVLRKFKH